MGLGISSFSWGNWTTFNWS